MMDLGKLEESLDSLKVGGHMEVHIYTADNVKGCDRKHIRTALNRRPTYYAHNFGYIVHIANLGFETVETGKCSELASNVNIDFDQSSRTQLIAGTDKFAIIDACEVTIYNSIDEVIADGYIGKFIDKIKLKRDLSRVHSLLRELITMIEYMPGGPGYVLAKKDFESHQ
jgi:hypothetical protein